MPAIDPATAAAAPPWLPSADHPDFPRGPFAELLAFEGSLTARLTTLCGGRFSLALSAQRELAAGAVAELLPHEPAAWLPALCREVLMSAGGEPVVAARTLIPVATAAAQGWLADLGGRSLGHALFERVDVERSPFTFACCASDSAVVRRLRALAPAAAPASGATSAGGDGGHAAGVGAPALWARQSRFAVAGAPLLVMEVFLPASEALACRAAGQRGADGEPGAVADSSAVRARSRP